MADDVALDEVAEDDKAVLANLLQLYRYDLSAARGYELTEHGTYIYRFLDHYFLDDDRDAYFVRHDGQLAGFVMSRELPTGEREVAEFFVVRAHRRDGVGTRAAELLFAKHPGPWQVAFDHTNAEGTAFWPDVVKRVAVGEIDSEETGPPARTFNQTVLRFTNV